MSRRKTSSFHVKHLARDALSARQANHVQCSFAGVLAKRKNPTDRKICQHRGISHRASCTSKRLPISWTSYTSTFKLLPQFFRHPICSSCITVNENVSFWIHQYQTIQNGTGQCPVSTPSNKKVHRDGGQIWFSMSRPNTQFRTINNTAQFKPLELPMYPNPDPWIPQWVEKLCLSLSFPNHP